MKFSGKVGFLVNEKETEQPGVWKSEIIERGYFGDVNLGYGRLQPSEHQNDNFSTNSRVSILSDLYARQNWTSIRYVIWKGAKLKVTAVEISYPRIVLEVGGVYNGEDTIEPA